jgi:hypothetical protein
MKGALLGTIVGLYLTVISSPFVWAQATGQISGTVKDQRTKVGRSYPASRLLRHKSKPVSRETLLRMKQARTPCRIS